MAAEDGEVEGVVCEGLGGGKVGGGVVGVVLVVGRVVSGHCWSPGGGC